MHNHNFLNLNQKSDIMTKTEENLKAAFAGESQANRKYLAFAKKALKIIIPQKKI